MASARGKQTYELNKNVRWATVYDPDDDFPEPAEYTDMLGVLKVSWYSIPGFFNTNNWNIKKKEVILSVFLLE